MNFTPGPWKPCHHLRSEESDKSCPCGFPGDIWGSDGNHVVCTMGPYLEEKEGVGPVPDRYPRETELANARLISTAPELYLALCDAHDHLLMYSPAPDSDALIKHIRSLIAKVDGKNETN